MMDAVRRWWFAACGCAATAWASFAAMQVLSGQPFPPPISLSQYGLGPHGWIFSVFVLAVVLIPVCLYLWRPIPGFGIRILLAAGVAGALVMASVRTDYGGAGHPWNAVVHQVAAILVLCAMPLVVPLIVRRSGRGWLVGTIALVAVIAISLVLLLVSAHGVDTSGLGAERSWALWQAVAVVLDLVLATCAVIATRPLRRGSRVTDGRDRGGYLLSGGSPMVEPAVTRRAGDPARSRRGPRAAGACGSDGNSTRNGDGNGR